MRSSLAIFHGSLACPTRSAVGAWPPTPEGSLRSLASFPIPGLRRFRRGCMKSKKLGGAWELGSRAVLFPSCVRFDIQCARRMRGRRKAAWPWAGIWDVEALVQTSHDNFGCGAASMDPLFAACERGDLVRLERLVAKDSTLLHGKNSNFPCETLLHCACRYVYSLGT